MLELWIGQVPEAIYFAWFMILTKNIKSERLIFTMLMILEEIILIRVFPESIWFNVLYTAMFYIILKILYKEKVQITDIFTFMISNIILLLATMICYWLIYIPIGNFAVAVATSRLMLILFLLITRDKLNKIQKLYKKFWNRNDKLKKKMKSTTFRCINLVLFNLMFYLANTLLLIAVYQRGGV